MRLDEYVAKEFNVSKSKAQDMIKDQRVMVNSKVTSKKSTTIQENDTVSLIKSDDLTFVSRAGNKLYHAILECGLQLKDRVCLDVGASTGGFSDCCLQLEAKKVFAIEVGKDQLDPSLYKYENLILFENFNARNLTYEVLNEYVDFVCCDVSFISLRKILPQMVEVAKMESDFLLLFKPQFECGKEFLNKHGVVKDQKIVEKEISQFIHYAYTLDLKHISTQRSSVVGRAGNQEYVLHFRKESLC